jgi:hypothetical protein
MLRLHGTATVTVPASRKSAYVDAGAKCSDGGDGDISGDVIVHTSMASLEQPGDYWFVYECKNSQGRSAIAATRIVKIVDNLCPVCSVKSAPANIEASFPYTDAGATCTDALDGNIATSIFSFGTVKPVSEIVNVERTGVYTITYRALDSSGNWNDGSCTGSQHGKNVRTITVIDTLKPVLALNFKGKVVQVGSGGFAGSKAGASEPHQRYQRGVGGQDNAGTRYTSAQSFFALNAKRRLMEAIPAQDSKIMGGAAVIAAMLGVALAVYSVTRSKKAHPEPIAL